MSKARLMSGIQTYELDPRAACSVPTVEVHQFEASLKLITDCWILVVGNCQVIVNISTSKGLKGYNQRSSYTCFAPFSCPASIFAVLLPLASCHANADKAWSGRPNLHDITARQQYDGLGRGRCWWTGEQQSIQLIYMRCH